MGLRGPEKLCEWVYFSTGTLKMLVNILPKRVNRHQVTRYAKRHGLVLPKYVRKFARRLMIKVMSREATRFVQS